MSQIEVSVYDQTAYFTHTPDIFSGGVGTDSVKFTFDKTWNGFNTKTAVFYNDPKKSYPVILDSNNVATIPKTVINKECTLYFGVMGATENGTVKTSSILSYRIARGVISADTEVLSPSTDVWLQILANYEFALNRLADMNNTLTDMDNRLEVIDNRIIESAQENKANINLNNLTNDATNVLLSRINMDNLPDGTTYHKVPFFVQVGTVTKTSPLTVTFPVAYKTAPVVVCMPNLTEDSSTSVSGAGYYLKTKVTKTGFTLYSYLTQDYDNINWVAFGEV